MEEKFEIIDDAVTQSEVLEVNQASISYLDEARKWAKFLSILLFIGAGVVIIFGLLSVFGIMAGFDDPTPGMGGMMPAVMGIIMILVSLLYLVPAIFLLRFSNYMKVALLQRSNVNLEVSFKNLKGHFKFLGILSIVFIALYALAFIIAAIAAAVAL